MATHTRGPWSLETVRTSCGLVHKIGQFPTGMALKPLTYACVYEDGMSKQVDHARGRLDTELLANARLIAAAPTMHRELELAADTFRDFSSVLRSIGKDVMSAAADVAERHIREYLAAIPKAEPVDDREAVTGNGRN